MINLLPAQTKKEIRAARMNVILLRYNLLALGAVGLLAAFCLLFFGLLGYSESTANGTSTTNASKAEDLKDVRKTAEEYQNNLKIAKLVLNSGVSYEKLVYAIAALFPKGAVLDSLALNSTAFGQQTTFSAHTVDYDTARRLKENFQNAKDLFSNVFFQNLTGATAGSSKEAYPISVSMSAKLVDEGKLK